MEFHPYVTELNHFFTQAMYVSVIVVSLLYDENACSFCYACNISFFYYC